MEIIKTQRMGNSSNSTSDYEEFDLRVEYANGQVTEIRHRWSGDGHCWSELAYNGGPEHFCSSVHTYDDNDINRMAGCSRDEIQFDLDHIAEIEEKVADLYAAANAFETTAVRTTILDEEPQEGDSSNQIYRWHYSWS